MPNSAQAFETPADCKCILVLSTTHHTLLAEEKLQSQNIRYIPIPKPQKAISECGMALQIKHGDLRRAATALQAMDVRFFLRRGDDEIEPITSKDILQGEER